MKLVKTARSTVVALAIGAMLLVASPAVAATTTKGPACQSKEWWDEFTGYVIANDTAGGDYLFSSGKCLMLKAGLKCSVMDEGLFDWIKIRVYAGKKALILWTSSDFVVK